VTGAAGDPSDRWSSGSVAAGGEGAASVCS
jgi:hypothetical protein